MPLIVSGVDRHVDQHHLVVAAAARYDHHPNLVVPISPPRTTRHFDQKGRCCGDCVCCNSALSPSPIDYSTALPNASSSSSSSPVQSIIEEDMERISPLNDDQESRWRRNNGVKTGRNKMERGISKASDNEILVFHARNQLENQFQNGFTSPDSPDSGITGSGSVLGAPGTNGFYVETPMYTFLLPDITVYSDDFRSFLEKDLIEVSSLLSLEQSGRLNWWAETGTCQRLWPLATTGDGNCLLHAASLGMWGFHDRLLTLRKALYTFLSFSPSARSIYRRWRWQSHRQNLQFELRLSEKEWDDVWKAVLRLASSEPRHGSAASEEGSCASNGSSTAKIDPNGKTRRWSRMSLAMRECGGGGGVSSASSSISSSSSDVVYESLEEVHVLALAHILRRPVIVVADTVLRDMNGEALAPIPFGGVYLPLECSASECRRSPLLLTYNAGHFSALVSMQGAHRAHNNEWLPAVIPLTDSNHTLLPLQFAFDPGEGYRWDANNDPECDLGHLEPNAQIRLLNGYLEMVKVALPEWIVDPIGYEQYHQHAQKANRQSTSVAKQFGSIGKKLKKNLGKLTRTSSFRGGKYDDHPGTRQVSHAKVVADTQNYILAAFIHTNQEPLPYQNEMVDNYLQEAKRRFDVDRELKHKQREEQQELDEKRKREIYLNGGYIDCLTPGCGARATHDNKYLCIKCFHEQERNSQLIVYHGKSKFYLPHEECESEESEEQRDNEVNEEKCFDMPELRVKLPPIGRKQVVADAAGSKPCRTTGCDFYGTQELDFFCSKCFLGLQEENKAKPARS